MAHEPARRAAGLLVMSALTLSAPARAQTPEPDGNEFQVNSFTPGHQRGQMVASDANGNFVVVWHSDQDGSYSGVFGQRFSSAGALLGSEFQINSYTTAFQQYPAVSSDPNGNFVVVWESYVQDGGGLGVFGRRFDSGGSPLGAEFRVNSYTTDHEAYPAVASDANGNFVVVWSSYGGQDGSGTGVFGRRFDSGGNPLGSDFPINSYTTANQSSPHVATDAGGNFVVVWKSYGQDGSLDGIFGQRFDASGARQGGEFQVNSYTTYHQQGPTVASDEAGNFAVVWISADQDGSGPGVFGRRFSASGVPQGSEFRVNSYTTSFQFGAAVASSTNGDFVVVWNSFGQDGSDDGVFARRFDSGSSPLGTEFRINSYTTGSQRLPTVASNAFGDFVVAWDSLGQDGSGYGVFGQRFGPPDLIFADGVESGDLTRWSSSVTDGTDLRATVPAAMAGTAFGLQAQVNDTNSLYVVDDTPVLERRYRARFYFDPNGFDPGEAMNHFRIRIFIAFDPSGLRVVTLVLKRQGGAYSIETRVRRNDGTRADTGFVPLSNAPHFLEFAWRRATGPGASDGSLEMWIDGTSMATLAGIDNDLSSIDFARLGALAVKTGAAGTLFFDQFESRRRNYVGP
jgi:hypothetical protein